MKVGNKDYGVKATEELYRWYRLTEQEHENGLQGLFNRRKPGKIISTGREECFPVTWQKKLN